MKPFDLSVNFSVGDARNVARLRHIMSLGTDRVEKLLLLVIGSKPQNTIAPVALVLRAPNKTSAPAACVHSPQLRVLRFGFLQDGDVGVGVFPQRQEILIRGPGSDRVALHSVSAGQAEAGQRAPWRVRHQAAVVDELLKFRCCRDVVVEREISFSTQINRA
jgi:hypothetical protein